MVWTFDQWIEKKSRYPWLFCSKQKIGCEYCKEIGTLKTVKKRGVEISKEWSMCTVDEGNHLKKQTRLANLRNKVKKHSDSFAHQHAYEIKKEKESEKIVKNFEAKLHKNHVNTEYIFRTAYYIAKYNRPFDDHFKLIELQKANGISLGSILHSRYSATTIIDHIATKMREQLVKNIIDCSAKLSVLIDESTTLSSKTSMVVYIKSAISNDDPIFMFLDLVELDNQLAVNIVDKLLACLHKCGFDETFLQKNWVSFVSDGASVLLGKKNGVAKRLKDKYPLIFSWHCMNHRLELAVNDSVKDVTATNHFKAFLDSLYALYNRSPKNQNELKTICTELDMIFLKVGRVLDVRWVASSYRAVQAIWKIFPALYNHLYNASNDTTKDKKTQSKYTGLYKKLGSPQFVLDLALMCDILKELSYLSNQLQSHTVTLLQADQLIKSNNYAFQNNQFDQ
ncbi:unnamed protein product [Macrosiphum euphorbiae]|uniref:E3 SUMO-protein ligase KIAA1586-like n=1 Tax=Macrosiphum euphorbiae TaxID=13131 RepID=A0AAV0XGE7_9HEMI|nr:unnamed protein product [Macrosiphum euphorbiae]